MTDARKLGLGMGAWVLLVSTLHLSLNVDWKSFWNEYLPEAERKLNVAYIPVT